jgi:hypothetical protein
MGAVVLVLGGLLVGTTPLDGQMRVREGVWFGAGIGGGTGRVGCEICASELQFGPSVTARFGGTLSSSLLLGVEGNGWVHYEGDEDAESAERRRLLAGLSVVMYWYPNAASGFFFKGGFGPVAFRLDDVRPLDEDGERTTPFTSTSLGGNVGIGYDLRVGNSLSITPFFNYVGSLYGNLTRDDTNVSSANLTLLQFGLGITRH